MLENFRTYQIAKELYGECKKIKLSPVVKDQLDRASLSIVLNLAEGSGKKTIKDKRKYYYQAFGSTREVQAILDLEQERDLFRKSDILAASIYKLMQKTVAGYP